MRKPLWVPPSSAAKRNAGYAGDPTLDPLGDKGVGIHPLWQEGHDEKPALGTVKAHIGMEFLFHLAEHQVALVPVEGAGPFNVALIVAFGHVFIADILEQGGRMNVGTLLGDGDAAVSALSKARKPSRKAGAIVLEKLPA